MWRSSSKPASEGFTLMEVLVVLAALGMILWMAGQLLFPMRQAAERQRLQVEARQTARSAADYAAYVIRGATDMNDLATPRNPAALLTYLWKGSNPSSAGANFPTCPGDGGCMQLSYNNVDQPATHFASNGSDIITLTVAQVTYPVMVSNAGGWPSPFTNASVQYWAFDLGCNPGGPAANTGAQDAANFTQFKSLTQDPTNPTTSLPMIVWDPGSGAWLVYRITDFRDGSNGASCTGLNPACVVSGNVVPCIEVNASPQDANSLNPPGGAEQLANLPNLVVGSRFATLRVCNGWLEQKNGVFDPTADANCRPLSAGAEFPTFEEMVVHSPQPGWSPLLPNVEDFQVAYLFRDGSVWNRVAGTLTAAQGCSDGVPSSNAAIGNPTQFDVRNVVALRITVTARSSTPVSPTGEGKMALGPPSAEDHDTTGMARDTYYRYQLSTTVMLRNRTSGI
jgi:prepilin-type N-terminal cleavage/methylation domain-containing protein